MPGRTRKNKMVKKVKKATRRRASMLMDIVRTLESKVSSIRKTIGKVVGATEHVAVAAVKSAENEMGVIVKKVKSVL